MGDRGPACAIPHESSSRWGPGVGLAAFKMIDTPKRFRTPRCRVAARAVRRRAAVALAAFEGREAEMALERAAHDRDWQVRQVAEDLIGDRETPD